MTRVLFIDCAPFVGGAQESFATLVGGFPDSAVAVGDGLAARFPNATRFHARHWPSTLKGLSHFFIDRMKVTPVLERLIADYTPEVIHANTLRSALLLTSLKLPCPLIVHDRDIKALRPAVRYVAHKLRPTVIAISSTVAEKWSGLVPQDYMHIIYNGFSLESIRAAAPVEFSWDGPTIALVADFVPWKRHKLFMDAFVLARQRIPNLRAVIRGRCRSIGDEYTENIIQFSKNIPNIVLDTADGPALGHIAASNLVVSCSENEPFGRTVIEALALSKTVVATPFAAPPELFKLLSPNLIKADDSPQALADAIVDNIHRTFTPIALDAFSAETMIAKVAAVHSRLIAP